MSSIEIVPEPKALNFKGQYYDFDGFSNFDDFLSREFQVPWGSWSLDFTQAGPNSCDLEVEKGVIRARGDRGICYATVLQLLRQSPHSLPAVRVQESFRFDFRGFHLDVARGGVPTVETLKAILRWLFLLKYNCFGIYVEDLFPWSSHPEIGVHRGRYRTQEWEEVEEYGRKLGIEVFPSLELLGHMERILALPQYWRYKEMWWSREDGCIDPTDEGAKGLVQDLLGDVLRTSKAQHVLVGGDETWSLGRGRSLDKSGGQFRGPELYLSHYSSIIGRVREAGRTPILWGDMLTGMYLTEEERRFWASVKESDIWRGSIIANWDYSPSPVEKLKEKILNVGHLERQIACPGLSNWNRFYPNFDVALTNVTNFLKAAKEVGIMGFMITAWGDDGSECLFSLLNPLILASMEIAEGKGEWEGKYGALSREDSKVIQARKSLGRASVADNLKQVIYLDRSPFLRDREKVRGELEGVLEELQGLNLPEDLSVIRELVRVGLKVLREEATPLDFQGLVEAYAKAWLRERKPEGLSLILSRLSRSQLILRFGLRG